MATQLARVRSELADQLAKIDYREPVGAGPLHRPRTIMSGLTMPFLPRDPSADGGPWQFVSQLDRPVYSGEKAHVRSASLV